MTTHHNPLAYVRHLKHASGQLRSMADKADAIIARIAREQAELAAMEAEAAAMASAHWTLAEIAEARADVLADLQRAP